MSSENKETTILGINIRESEASHKVKGVNPGVPLGYRLVAMGVLLSETVRHPLKSSYIYANPTQGIITVERSK